MFGFLRRLHVLGVVLLDRHVFVVFVHCVSPECVCSTAPIITLFRYYLKLLLHDIALLLVARVVLVTRVECAAFVAALAPILLLVLKQLHGIINLLLFLLDELLADHFHLQVVVVFSLSGRHFYK